MEHYFKMNHIVIPLESLVTKISDYQTSLNFDSIDLSGLFKYIELKKIESFIITKDSNDEPYRIALFSQSTDIDKDCKYYFGKEKIIKTLKQINEKVKIDINYNTIGKVHRIILTTATKIIEISYEENLSKKWAYIEYKKKDWINKNLFYLYLTKSIGIKLSNYLKKNESIVTSIDHLLLFLVQLQIESARFAFINENINMSFYEYTEYEAPVSVLFCADDINSIDNNQPFIEIKNKYLDIITGRIRNSNTNNSYSKKDAKRDTFDAITDGQMGDFNDFDGDIDDLMNWSGRD